jgi:hypothetical protein
MTLKHPKSQPDLPDDLAVAPHVSHETRTIAG